MLRLHQSLFSKLVIPFVLLVSTLVALTAWNGFSSGKRTADEISATLLSNVLSSTENATRDWLVSGQVLVDSVSIAVAKGALPFEDTVSLERYLYSLVTASRPGTYIYIGYPDGRYVGVSYNEDKSVTSLIQEKGDPIRRAYIVLKPGDRGQALVARTGKYDARTRPWYQLAIASATPRWTPIYSSASKKILEVSYASPIRDAGGNLLGVVCTDIPLSYLSDFLSRQPLPPSGVAYLTDASGQLIASSRMSSTFVDAKGQRLKATEASDVLVRESAQALKLHEIGPGASKRTEGAVIVASSVVPPFRAATSLLDAAKVEYNWIMTVAANEEEFSGHARSNLLELIWLGLITVMAGIALGAWLVKRLVRDISTLEQTAEQIGSGNLSGTSPLSRNDELGQLSRSVENMRTQLSSSREKIERHTTELELRVAERTRELALRNEALQREMQERERAQSTARVLSLALSETTSAVMIINASGVIDYANSGAEELTGFHSDELVGMAYSALYAKGFEVERRRGLDTALSQHQRWTGTVARMRKDGTGFQAEVILNPVTTVSGEQLTVCVETDVTDRENVAARMRREVTTDALTGLGTRRAFDMKLEELKLRGHAVLAPFTVMFMDLDGFKPINDQFGHEAGDGALREVADRIRATLRRDDTAYRFGGDEFVMIVPGADAKRSAERVLERMHAPITVMGHSVPVGVSIGIAVYPEHGTDVDMLMRRADQAMYASKATGNSGVMIWREDLRSR
jgi:diguanylate cyclase (GGDEF)-like protein/PAS domain S-box-containing protein